MFKPCERLFLGKSFCFCGWNKTKRVCTITDPMDVAQTDGLSRRTRWLKVWACLDIDFVCTHNMFVFVKFICCHIGGNLLPSCLSILGMLTRMCISHGGDPRYQPSNLGAQFPHTLTIAVMIAYNSLSILPIFLRFTLRVYPRVG